MKALLNILLLLFSSSIFAQHNAHKIISYNVYVGMKTDTSTNKKEFANWFREQDADIVALEEMPSRIDFIFVSKDLKKQVKTAQVLVDEFTNTHSDHYPMMMELTLKDKK